MRIAFGLLYFGICLGKLYARWCKYLVNYLEENPIASIYRCTFCSPIQPFVHKAQSFLFACSKIKTGTQESSNSAIMIYGSKILLLPASSSFPAAVQSQFIEVSRETIHSGDTVTLKCLLLDDVRDSKDVTNYIWYLNSESREKEETLSIFLFSVNLTVDICFTFCFFLSILLFFVLCSPETSQCNANR